MTQAYQAVINGAGIVSTGGIYSSLNITAATVIKATKGRIAKVIVLVAGSTAGSVNDSATIGGVAASNLVSTIPAAVASISLDFPCANGIVVTPGTGQTLAVSFI